MNIVAATFACAITMIAQIGQFAVLFGGTGGDDREGDGNILGALRMIFLARPAATIIQLAISRSREFGADRTGAATGGDPAAALASALEKLEAFAARVAKLRMIGRQNG